VKEKEKQKKWGIAVSLAKVDKLKPSKEMIFLIKKEINGEISKTTILKNLKRKYQDN